jgi:hypothetical protein
MLENIEEFESRKQVSVLFNDQQRLKNREKSRQLS